MKIVRALSVEEGKGAVSWMASQSREGTVSRGNLAACVSGAEKSRQMRQDEVDCEGGGGLGDAPILGFVDSIFVRSGLDDMGIGGGVLSLTCGLGLGISPFVPFGRGSSGLVIPHDKADLAGIGGGSLGGSFLCGKPGPMESCLAGVRGGRFGIVGEGDISATVTLGVDLADFDGVLAFPISCVCLRFGGNGGSFAGS